MMSASRSLSRQAPLLARPASSSLSVGAFRATARAQAPAIKPEFQPHVGKFSPEAIFKWVPTLAFWGAAGGGAVMLFASGIPKFKHDVLFKIPFVAEYFKDKTPDSDKPF